MLNTAPSVELECQPTLVLHFKDGSACTCILLKRALVENWLWTVACERGNVAATFSGSGIGFHAKDADLILR